MTQSRRKFDPLFLVRAVLDPVDSFDLTDRNGATDHGKAVPFAVLVFTAVTHLIGNPLPLWHMIVMVSASFGYGSWRTFLNAKLATRAETAASTTITNVVHTIAERRDSTLGIDPTE